MRGTRLLKLALDKSNLLIIYSTYEGLLLSLLITLILYLNIAGSTQG